MKALIGNIQKFSTEDGPGIRSTVFIKGCPLKCLWCHNPEMISPAQQMIVSPKRCIGCMECMDACPNNGIHVTDEGPQIDWEKCEACGSCMEKCFAKAISAVGTEMSVDEIISDIVKDKEFYDSTGGGVTISGGELLMHYDFSKALVDACAKAGIGVCLDTSGYGDCDKLMDLACADNIQYILFDIKHADDEMHKKYTGVSNKIILENLNELAKNPITRDRIWIRMPLISGVNDSDEIINEELELFKYLGIKMITLIAYHELGKSKAEHSGAEHIAFAAPSDERMQQIKIKFENIGIKVEITGNGDAIM